MVVILAVAPGLSFASGIGSGAFGSVLFHSHADGDHDHSHHGHHGHSHHHDGDAGDHHQANEDGVLDDQGGGAPRVHVHFEAACPSIVMPDNAGSLLEARFAGVIAIPMADTLDGEPPGRLLRPPISV